MQISLYNSLTRTKEPFEPLQDNLVRMYHCGPTVYDYAHVGNFRSYIFADILRRTMEYAGYDVQQVMNVTDVGHLSSDADEGEDKMSTALRRAGKELTLANMRELADFYVAQFKQDMQALNIKLPHAMPRASEFIEEQIQLIKRLEEKDATYQTSDGVYFDTSAFPSYGALGGVASEEYSRTGVSAEKRNPRDFALWKFPPAGGLQIGWDSPWGKGFPGWHIECSAMSMNELGEQFDIHTGGIDLMTVHHNNEIAQSETATGKPLANYWMHSAHVSVDGKKMAKSEGNFVTLRDVQERGYNPFAFRYLVLQTHYRSPMNFTWEALEGADNALNRIYNHLQGLDENDLGDVGAHKKQFHEAISDDLNTPQALAVLHTLIDSQDIAGATKKKLAFEFDRVLGLGLEEASRESPIPQKIQALVSEREEARKGENYKEADRLREEIHSHGFEVQDTDVGPRVRRSS